jgi:hypothetical protein
MSGLTDRQVRQLAGMLEPSPQQGGPPFGAKIVLLRDLTRPDSRPGCVVAVLEKQWRVRSLDSVRGWRGPRKPTEKFGRRWLQGISYGEVLVDIGGNWDPMPVGVRVIS